MEQEGNIVYLKKERLLKKFCGDESMEVEEWIGECKFVLKENKLVGKDAVTFIIQHLYGNAKREVRLHSEQTSTAEDVFVVLTNQFTRQSYTEAIKKFYAKKQGTAEGIREYTYDLKELLDKALRLKPKCFPNPEETLKDQFVAGIRESILRKEIKKTLMEKPSLSFLELRKIAIDWSEDSSPSPSPQTANAFFAQAEQEKKQNNDIEEMKKVIKQQQDMIASLSKTVKELTLEKMQNKEQAKSQIVCFRCGSVGHMKRECKQELGDDTLTARDNFRGSFRGRSRGGAAYRSRGQRGQRDHLN